MVVCDDFSQFSDIQKWYSGRSVFITGGTGFMGKVLVEKLLRSCPLIDRIYLLVREKNGCPREQRHKTMIALPLFDKIREQCPKVLGKLIFIEGDLLTDNLGLSPTDREQLIENVSVVFHLGASLKLQAGLRDAVLTNTLGTKMVLDLCCKMKKIISVNHLSTAFCHCNIKELKEQVYKPNRDPYEMISYVLEHSQQVLDENKYEILQHHPNSYTFSKCLAEWIVKDYERYIPVSIARPSVVIPALRDPISGWVDSLNGPTGIMVAAAKGVLRSLICREDYHAEIIPVDLAINAFIIISYERGIDMNCNELQQDGVADAETFVDCKTTDIVSNEDTTETTAPQQNGDNEPLFTTNVYNITCPREVIAITWGDVLNRAKNLIPAYPYEWMLWYPDGALRTNKIVHWFVVVLFQWLPALLVDGLLMLIRVPTFMVRLQRKLIAASSVFEYFTTKVWSFEVERTMAMSNRLSRLDREIFYLLPIEYDIDEYMVNCILGSRKFCMKENESSLWLTRIHFRILQALHFALRFYLWYCIVWYALQIRHTRHFLDAVHHEIRQIFEGMTFFI